MYTHLNYIDHNCCFYGFFFYTTPNSNRYLANRPINCIRDGPIDTLGRRSHLQRRNHVEVFCKLRSKGDESKSERERARRARERERERGGEEREREKGREGER